MTQFTPYTRSPDDPSYEGASKGFDPVHPNLSAASAVEGFGNFADTAIKGLDELYKISFTKDLSPKIEAEKQAEVSAGRDLLSRAQGNAPTSPTNGQGSVSDTGEVGGNPLKGETSPGGVDRAYRQMTMLAQANKAGKFDDLNFDSNLQVIVQNTISQYPGYADDIRRKASELKGVGFADDIRRNINETLGQMYGNARSADEKWSNDVEKWMPWLGEKGTAKALTLRSDSDRNGVRAYVAGLMAVQHDQKNEESKINLALSKDRLDVAQAEGSLNKFAGAITTGTLEGFKVGVAGFTGTWNDMLDIIHKTAASGEPMDPKVQQSLGLAAGQFQDAALNAFDRGVVAPRFGADGTPLESYSTVIKNPEAIAKARAQIKTNFETVTTQIGAGNMALATATMSLITNTGTNMALKMISIPAVQQVKGLEVALGGPVAAQFLNTAFAQDAYKTLNNVAAKVLQVHTIDLVTNPTTLPDPNGLKKVTADYAKVQTVDNADPKPPANLLRAVIDQSKEIVVNKDLSVQQRVKTVQSIVANGTEDFLKDFNRAERFDAWARLADPSVGASVKSQLGEETWGKYKTWIATTFKGLFNNYIDTANEGTGEAHNIANAKFNEETGQITADRIVGGRVVPSDTNFKGVISANPSAVSLQRVNLGLRILSNTLALDGEKITPETIKLLGLNLNNTAHGVGNLVEIQKAFAKYLATELVTGPAQAVVGGVKKLIDPSQNRSLGTPDLFTKDQPLPMDLVPATPTLQQWLQNPAGMPVYKQSKNADGEVITVRNSPETPVKQVQDAAGNSITVIRKDGVWHKFVPIPQKTSQR